MSAFDTRTDPELPVLPATTRLGAAHLTVGDLDRSVSYYQDVTGMRQHERDASSASMGTATSEPLLVLHEDQLAVPADHHAGLFHLAFLYPSRLELARAARRLVGGRIPISGASDHGVSEALYLRDPDGNGIELYSDRPREEWPPPAPGSTDRVGIYTRPLDLGSLLALAEDEKIRAHAADGLTIGHLHLHVGSITAAIGFYGDVVGLDLMATVPGAAFLAADGYHHHLGVNTWAGEGVGPAPEHTAGLREWTIVLPDPADVVTVRERLVAAGAPLEDGTAQALLTRDPWGTALRVRV